MKFYLLFALLIIPLELPSLNLYELDPNKEYLKSGQKLMDLDFGLHDLEANQVGKQILISIHGRDSRGFEWIYPLQTIDNEVTKTYFFRWDTTRCTQKTIPILMKEISAMKDIKKGDELSYDYGFSFDENFKQFPCYCRSKNCVGYIVREGSRWRIKKKKKESNK